MDGKRTILNYSEGPPRRPPTTPRAALGIADALIVLPILCSVFLSTDVPANEVLLPITIAVAFGASLFVVRRRPGNFIGWFGLFIWGLLTLLWITVPLLSRR